MKEIKIMREIWHLPLWYYDDNGDISEPFNGIEDDSTIQECATAIMDLNDSYYEFDSHDVACWYNEEQEKKDKGILLDLVTRLKSRLNELNDGSYIVTDEETDYLSSL